MVTVFSDVAKMHFIKVNNKAHSPQGTPAAAKVFGKKIPESIDDAKGFRTGSSVYILCT
jgi:hypothetical protein